ncbi:MAG: hypothetical protein KAW09_05355, partial [Thermoplasmata archaeon]|nr:hypothetical protein [Thermoplasmata archaeon]
MKYISKPQNKSEKIVLQAIEDHLRARGHDIVLQMKIRTWRPDLVALKGEDVVIVEVKGSLGDIDKAVAQAAAYTID